MTTTCYVCGERRRLRGAWRRFTRKDGSTYTAQVWTCLACPGVKTQHHDGEGWFMARPTWKGQRIK